MKKSFKKYEKAGLPGGPNELKRFTNGFIISERGQWDYPGQPTAVPTPSGRITMKGVKNNLLGIDNLGNTQYMTPGNEYQFEGDMVYEIPQARKGGSKKPSKKYSRSLMAKNRLFAKNPLFEKKKSAKNKIFDPNSPYYQDGGGLLSNMYVEDTDWMGDKYKDIGRDIYKNKNFKVSAGNYFPKNLSKQLGLFNPYVNIGYNVKNLGNFSLEAAPQNIGLTFRRSFQDGGITKLSPEEEIEFQKFYATLPENLQTDDATYDIRGYWDSEGRPEKFNYDQPKESDGYYHAYSINSNTGEYLKSPVHETFQHAVDEDRKIGWRPITNVYGRNIATENPLIATEEQSFLRNIEGPSSYIETELTDDEINEYRKGGYIVEDISVPSLTRMDDGGSKPKKDKWGRSPDSKWYGFDPKTKQWTLGKPKEVVVKKETINPKQRWKNVTEKKDKWGRSESDEWYGFDPKTKKYTLGDWKGYTVKSKKESLDKTNQFNQYLRKVKEYEDWNENADWTDRLAQTFGFGPQDPRYVTGLNPSNEKDYLTYVMPTGIKGAGVAAAIEPYAETIFKDIKKIGNFGLKNFVPSTAKNATAIENFVKPVNVKNAFKASTVYDLGTDYIPNIIQGKDVGENSADAVASIISLTPLNSINTVNQIKNAYSVGKYGSRNLKDPRNPVNQYKFYNALSGLAGYKKGGIVSELTKKEIDELIKQGYIIEEVSAHPLTKASYGHSVGNLIRKQPGGSVSGTQGLTADFSQRLTQFILDAKAQGIDLGIGSGYRSYEKQKRLWEQALKKYGSPEKARKWVAPPGGSFHNKGLAVDLNSNGQFLGKEANSKATEWAHANAKKYGLHFRMGHEPWHIEPIEKTKSSSEKENEHDHISDDKNNNELKPTNQEEYDKMIEAKNIEFEAKERELEERERALHNDDYSNWEPAKKQEVEDPLITLQEDYLKLIAPSSKNVYEQFVANKQNQMKNGGSIMYLDDNEINHYKNKGYIIEELPKAQEGIQVGAPVWSNINTNAPVIQNAIPEVERAITERVVVKPEVKAQPVVTSANKEKTFEEAHAEARSTLGPNAIFEFNGRKYGTNNPGEDFKPDEKTLEKSGLNTENVKQNIEKQNKELDDPYISKKTVKVQEKEYEDWDKIKEKNIELNKSSNANKIIKYKTGDKSGKNYIIIDKKKGLLHIYSPGSNQPLFSAPVDLGANKGDAQTTTKVKDTNGDGVIDNIEAQKAKADFSLGNKMTGAGKYYISNIDPKGYGDLPLFNMMNESQYSNYLKTGKIDNVATSLHKGYISDDENRVSNGCIRCNITTLKNLTKYLQNSSEVYILPEDEGNEFIYENGQLNFKVKHKGDLYTYKNNGKIYKKENNTWYVAPKAGSSFTKITEGSRIKELNKNATNAGYNYYVDSHGKVQKGQGVNKGPTLNYIPIKTSLDEEKFRDEKFTAWDFSDEQELKKVKEFTKSLQDNKQKIMKAAKINGDVYNDIAKITFGIFGTESNYADTHSGVGNFARAVNKALSPSSSSSPDYLSKYYTYGANEDYRSVGPTQMRWSYLSEDEKKALKEVGIKSNSELMYPSNAALATAVVLGIRYNQQLNDKEKKDIWKNLPKTWNTRANYADRVKDNSKYLILEQKNIKDPKLIAKSNIKDVYVYKGNANAKYKKDKNGNWYVNYGNKTKNKFIRLNDPTGARSKLLDANAIKLKKFTR